jgi:predicted  nucleic acid-binding Zn-ribbon protein
MIAEFGTSPVNGAAIHGRRLSEGIMGPTNVALVKYFQADQQLRAAQSRLDAATKDVRVQERRTNDLAERQKLAHSRLRETQSQSGQMELDLKTRDAHIEKLRNQQQFAKTNKEYQAFLIEINTAKVDRNKVEDETMTVLESVERLQQELKDLGTQVDAERSKLAAMRAKIGDRIAQLQADIEALQPAREEAAQAVPRKAREMFDRMADRFDGEAMAALSKPDRRREEYVCTSCNMDLVTDVYNKLHSRDELIFCPSCRRILFIPDDLPPEVAIKAKPVKKSGPVDASAEPVLPEPADESASPQSVQP